MADDPTDQSSSAEDAEPVESLISGRSRRSTAGRHMSALLNAEADDDLALLFEEVDDDEEFDEVEAGGGEEDDMALDSSSDDDDQGPNARPDDDEGERQLQKEEKAEKKKRRAQEDLRFKIARKKVKIDPTAVPTAAPPPRPKKKSERISWIPTADEGPTRSSSRRQTMHNKEMTHARLKDSEEKRVRLIATMEEAAKRKAHLKPKEITQAERLAEAERVERLNSKSLNLWEEMEKRKAEERKAKIEALQNRRLQGPVMSYWSGLATWTDGRLTRLGKVDITPKPEKEEPARRKSKKSEKEDKSVPGQTGAEGNGPGAGPAPSQTAPSGSENPAASTPAEGDVLKQSQDASQSQNPKPEVQEAPKDSGDLAGAKVGSTVDGSAGSEKPTEVGTTTVSTQPSNSTPNDAPSGDLQKPKSPKSGDAIMTEPPEPSGAHPTDAPKTDAVQESGSSKTTDAQGEPAQESTPKPKDAPTEPAQPAGSDAAAPTGGSVQELDSHKPEKEGETTTDRMDIDEEHKNEPVVTVDNKEPETQETPKEPASEKEPVANAEESQQKPASDGDKADDATKDAAPAPPAAASATPATEAPAPTATPGAPPNVEPPTEPEKVSPGAVPDGTPTPSVQPASAAAPTDENKSPGTVADQPAAPGEEKPPQPEIPAPPPVIEQAGRCLTILEDFDEKTAQSREFSIYFNAKKPPRLTKISSSLCVITSLPSRYRHKETSLPFSNSYAYREIHNTVDQKYQWSPMLGCYVGPVGVAARGVPPRFLGGPKAESKEGQTGDGDSAGKDKKKEGDTKSAGGAASTPTPTPTPVAAGGKAPDGDPMAVDNK